MKELKEKLQKQVEQMRKQQNQHAERALMLRGAIDMAEHMLQQLPPDEPKGPVDG